MITKRKGAAFPQHTKKEKPDQIRQYHDIQYQTLPDVFFPQA